MPATNSELDTVLNTLVDGVVMIDGDGIITRFNPACEAIFGHRAAEVMGRNVKVLMPEPYHSGHDGFIENYQTTGDAKIIGIGREVRGLRKNGDIFPMYLSVGDVPKTDGQAYVGIIRDLSEDAKRREDFEALQQAHFHLSRVSAMDQMGAAIAHELNQPLTAIMNYLGAGTTLLGQTENSAHPKLQQIMEKSAAQAERAAEILSRLRQFIETGDIEKIPTEAEGIIRTAVDLTLPLFHHANIQIDIHLADDLPRVVVNDVQIQQVLVNLIRNACEAMAKTPEKHLKISANLTPAQQVQINVVDTGVGLKPQDFETLYEPFTTDKMGGLGVGLSISRSIIANHDGHLWAEANPGAQAGASFCFTLPIVDA